LYDSLLDELEDDVVSTPQEVEELTEKVVDAEEADAELLADETDVVVVAEGDAETDSDSDAEAAGDSDEVLTEQVENWSDDPVRMYLTQMGEIPLLTRAQEISLARQIETTRAQFRAKLLECEFVAQQAYRVLCRVHRGELPFDRTVQVSVTDRLEKEQILGRLPHNLKTLEVLL
jgi:RNA polymerase primary sigma factor